MLELIVNYFEDIWVAKGKPNKIIRKLPMRTKRSFLSEIIVRYNSVSKNNEAPLLATRCRQLNLHTDASRHLLLIHHRLCRYRLPVAIVTSLLVIFTVI
ncbi:hypothetical protein IV203_025450 [Nitzschia inconspicua]|uniref:Uncharacterized protein n=1 Tax=Nitzschia inconspicua TaxID=303405 RepID=A0A9K3LK92_9STRA|nr:hypothetical protein IV203_028231 [Nitzschia inconspicua]KAG7362566.1 hypothetical protein IV203_025450 [Nitzschia inconspicua]